MNSDLQLYYFPTPNGQKITIALEEMQLPYQLHRIDITKGDQFRPDYVQINPNSKIPSLVDPNGPNGTPISLMESGAILMYLAQKSGLFFGTDWLQQSEITQWLFFQMASVGPMFGQFGHFFKYAGNMCDHPYPIERYTKESKRILEVLDRRLRTHAYLAGADYSIADMATIPWVHGLSTHYHADEKLELSSFKYISVWKEKILARPLTKKGLSI